MTSLTLNILLEKHCPEALEEWDDWDYRVWAPVSLADAAMIHVDLINAPGARPRKIQVRVDFSGEKVQVSRVPASILEVKS